MKCELLQQDRIIHNGKTLYRIRALKTFNMVTDGDLGGYIEHEGNLSQEGNCWVYGAVRVYGDARVYGTAHIFGTATPPEFLAEVSILDAAADENGSSDIKGVGSRANLGSCVIYTFN